MSASADVLAMAKVEVDLGAIPLGKNVIIKWRGKPIFVRHRTPEEIDEANKVDVKALRDPQTDEERVKKPEWLVMVGMYTFICVKLVSSIKTAKWDAPG
jgi:ubiquinol-cytochrome c reductase iron-sulfur subunit